MRNRIVIETIRIKRVSGVADVHYGLAGAKYIGSPEVDLLPAISDTITAHSVEQIQIDAEFVEVVANNGEMGVFGPVTPTISPNILSILNSTLVGCSVFAYEACWEVLFNAERHGRGGHYITALGAVDCALWDLRGRILDFSVFELLGGPTRDAIPCYVSLLGYEANSDEAEILALRLRELGFAGQKWALRDGPNEGEAGLARNVARVARLRRVVGKHYSLMFDALGKWTNAYAQAVLRAIQPYNVTYIEEPVGMAEEAAYQNLSHLKLAPIAAGEHLYTRFDCIRFLDKPWLDVLQPDVAWCGGLTEAIKITTLASIRSIPVYPHGGSLIAALHLAMSRPPSVVPAVEYHLTIEPKRQFFLSQKFRPANGTLFIASSPGLGITLDAERIRSYTYVKGEGYKK